jgi:hypothetical protein
MIEHLMTTGAVHGTLALGGVLTGLIRFFQAKGTPAHRALGDAYVCSMIAAGLNQLIVHALPFSTRGQVWIPVAVATVTATAVGVVLVGRYRHLAVPNPASRDQPASAMTAGIP